MKHILILTALMLTVFINVNAQSLDEVLDKYYKTNGLEKLAEVKTYYIKAQMNMMGMKFPMEIKVIKPNKFRVDVDMMGVKSISAFDGKNGWMKNPMAGSGVQDLKGEQLKQAMAKADLEGELYNYESKGSQAELIGKVDANGSQAYKIKLTDKDNIVKYYFIDAQSYLITKFTTNVKANGQNVDIDTKLTEYQDIDGIKLPKKVEVETSLGNQSIIMEEIKLNEPIDESVFEKPEN